MGHVALEIDGPARTRKNLTAPKYDQLSRSLGLYPPKLFSSIRKSVETVYLAMSYYAIRRMVSELLDEPVDDPDNDDLDGGYEDHVVEHFYTE